MLVLGMRPARRPGRSRRIGPRPSARARAHHSLSSHHRSSLSLSEPSRSSFDSDASTATNDCARASSARFAKTAATVVVLGTTLVDVLEATPGDVLDVARRRPRSDSSPASRRDSIPTSTRGVYSRGRRTRRALPADGSRSRRGKSASRAPSTTVESDGESLEGPPSAPTMPPRSRRRREIPFPARVAGARRRPEVLRARSRSSRRWSGRASEASFPPPPRCSRVLDDATHQAVEGVPAFAKKSPVSPYRCVCVCVCVFCFHRGERGDRELVDGAHETATRVRLAVVVSGREVVIC